MHAQACTVHAHARAAVALSRRPRTDVSVPTTRETNPTPAHDNKPAEADTSKAKKSPARKTARKPEPTVAELRERHLPTDRLWILEDVAAFLGVCMGEAKEIVKDPSVPQPRLSRGRLRRWSPAHWHAWMAAEDSVYVANDSSDDDELELGTI